MRRLALSIVFLLIGAVALAAPVFPELTGRVVDNAHVLSQSAVDYLTEKLAGYEAGTGNQIAVVTLPSLKDDTIDNYSNELFRRWGLGQKGKDNGVLLVIDPNEPKGHRNVRIEVGYRLEPVLTDVVSSRIINDIILPDFKAESVERGIVDGTQAIMTALGGNEVHMDHRQYAQQQPASAFQTVLGFIALILFLTFAVRHPFLTMLLLSNSRFGSSGGTDWAGNDNFRGGGGSAGGGGASGSW